MTIEDRLAALEAEDGARRMIEERLRERIVALEAETFVHLPEPPAPEPEKPPGVTDENRDVIDATTKALARYAQGPNGRGYWMNEGPERRRQDAKLIDALDGMFPQVPQNERLTRLAAIESRLAELGNEAGLLKAERERMRVS